MSTSTSAPSSHIRQATWRCVAQDEPPNRWTGSGSGSMLAASASMAQMTSTLMTGRGGSNGRAI